MRACMHVSTQELDVPLTVQTQASTDGLAKPKPPHLVTLYLRYELKDTDSLQSSDRLRLVAGTNSALRMAMPDVG